jgi:DNA-binding NarL/FixJ family response regulator
VQARERLREALEIFRDLDAPPWAAQAESELRAAGARHRSQRQTDSLSSQEIRVASAAARGATTKEIAAEMFLSPKTIEFHIGRVYRKLGVSNRAELASALARTESNGSVARVTD